MQDAARQLAPYRLDLDSLAKSIDSLHEVVNERHLDLLERINDQLSLGWTPYSVSFTILTALIAIMAIAAAVMIFLQGRDFRNRLRDSLAGHDREMKRTVATYRSLLDQALESFVAGGRAEIEELKIQLAQAYEDRPGEPGEPHDRAQERIAALQQRLDKATAETRAAENRLGLHGFDGIDAGARLPQPHELTFIQEHPDVAQTAKPAHRRGVDGHVNYSAICKGCGREFVFEPGFARNDGAYLQPCRFCGTSNIVKGAKASSWGIDDAAYFESLAQKSQK